MPVCKLRQTVAVASVCHMEWQVFAAVGSDSEWIECIMNVDACFLVQLGVKVCVLVHFCAILEMRTDWVDI